MIGMKCAPQQRPLTRLLQPNPQCYGTRVKSTHQNRSATNGTRHQHGKTHTDKRVQSHKVSSTSTQQSKEKTPNQSRVQREQEPARRNANRTDSSTHPRFQCGVAATLAALLVASFVFVPLCAVLLEFAGILNLNGCDAFEYALSLRRFLRLCRRLLVRGW